MTRESQHLDVASILAMKKKHIRHYLTIILKHLDIYFDSAAGHFQSSPRYRPLALALQLRLHTRSSVGFFHCAWQPPSLHPRHRSALAGVSSRRRKTSELPSLAAAAAAANAVTSPRSPTIAPDHRPRPLTIALTSRPSPAPARPAPDRRRPPGRSSPPPTDL